MATLYETMIKIGVDTSELDKGMDDAKDKVSGFGDTAKGVFAGNLIYNGVKRISSAIIGLAQDSLQTGMAFDKSMSQVAATLGVTTEDVKELRDFAQEMGETTAFSATQAADALNYMALAGYDSEKSMKMLPTVLNLAAAGGMELATASDMVTDASSALGLSMEETEAMVDQMARASSKSNTSVEQLGQAMLTVGGTAKVLKGGTTELATALGILADNGTKGAEGGTALRNILTAIQGDKFEKTFGELGISAYDAQGNLRSLEDVFSDMNAAMDGWTTEEKTDIINKTFNARDLKNVNALLATSTERWDELSGAIGDSAGAAEEMAKTQLDNLAGDMTLFQSAVEGAKIAISDGLSPALRTFVQGGTGLISTFTEAFKEGGVQGVIDAGVGMVNNLAETITKQAPQIVPAAMKAIVEFSDGLRKNVGQIVDAGLNLVTSLGNSLIDNLPVLIQTIPTIVSNIAGIINDNAPNILAAGAGLIMNLVQGIIDSWPVIVEEFPKIIQAILDVWQAVNWWQIGSNIITFIVNGVKSLVSALPTALKSIGEAGINVIKGINWAAVGKAIIQFILNGVKALASSIPSALAVMARNGMSKVTSVNWASVGRTVINKIKSGVSALASSIPKKLKETADSAKKKFTSIDWKDVGSKIVSGIAKGIANGASSIASAAKDAARNALKAAKDFLGIKSPSRVFRDEVGKMISIGLAEGIEDNSNEVEGAVEGLALMTTDPFDSLTSVEKTGTTETVGGDTYIFNLYGVNDPEDFANRAVRQFKLQARTV